MPVKITSPKPPSAARMRAVIQTQVKACLKDAGRFVRAKAAKYPAKADSTSYRRTGTLGRSIAVSEVTQSGGAWSVEVGTNLHYARYVEFGTGIYGPKLRRIKPISAKALAWRSTGKQMGPAGRLIAMGVGMRKGKLAKRAKKDVYMNFASSVRGMRPWYFMRDAFQDPQSTAYFKARATQMVYQIKADLAQAGAKPQ